MSRAINVNATTADVQALCDKHGLRISTLEALLSGGSRVVLTTSANADTLRIKMKDKLLTGTVERSSAFVARTPVPRR